MSTFNHEAIREQAARWADRLRSLTAEEREQFERWLIADERHAKEFQRASDLAVLGGNLQDAAQKELNTALQNDLRRAARWAKARPFAIAASLLLAVLLVGLFAIRPTGVPPETYVTKTGEMRTVAFPDGSVAYLNTRTQLRWVGDAYDRRVELFAGEVLFNVVHDNARPFRVVLDNSEVRVLGTKFNVYRKASDDVVVTVLEGTVEVQKRLLWGLVAGWQRELHANQQIAYRTAGMVRDVHPTIALKAVSWRDGKLEVQNELLPEVIEELTRYTDQRILAEDPRLAQFRLVGTLSVRDIPETLTFIEKLAPIAVKEDHGTFVLEYRPQTQEENH